MVRTSLRKTKIRSVFSYIPSRLNYHKTTEKKEFIIIFIVISIYSKRMWNLVTLRNCPNPVLVATNECSLWPLSPLFVSHGLPSPNLQTDVLAVSSHRFLPVLKASDSIADTEKRCSLVLWYVSETVLAASRAGEFFGMEARSSLCSFFPPQYQRECLAKPWFCYFSAPAMLTLGCSPSAMAFSVIYTLMAHKL